MSNLSGNDLENAPCGYITFSDAGTIISVNTTLLVLLEYHKKEELIGKNIESIFTIAGKIFYQTHFFPLIKLHDKAEEIFFTLKSKTKNIPVICNAKRIIQNDTCINQCILFPILQRGKYEQEILLARKQAEEALLQNKETLAAKEELEIHAFELDQKLTQLKQMNEDLIQFGKVISHDLQEPIRKIALFADKIAKENIVILADSSIKELNKINNEGQKIRKMVSSLEKFITLNLKTESIIKLDLNVILNEVLNGIILSTGMQDVNITIDSLHEIEGYKSQITMLFQNILDNCFIYHQKSKRLTIDVKTFLIQQNIYKEVKDKYRYVDFIKLTITDNGSGFELKNKSDIFLIGSRLDSISQRVNFGLAFCNKIVENHFGSISINTVKGKGTTVTILLPINQYNRIS